MPPGHVKRASGTGHSTGPGMAESAPLDGAAYAIWHSEPYRVKGDMPSPPRDWSLPRTQVYDVPGVHSATNAKILPSVWSYSGLTPWSWYVEAVVSNTHPISWRCWHLAGLCALTDVHRNRDNNLAHGGS